MDNQVSNVPGLNYPTQKGMISGNPRDSAIVLQTNSNIKQANLGNAVGGKNRKNRKNKKNTKYGGTSDNIIVPQFQMSYQSTGGPGQTPNSIIQQNAQTSTQSAANAVYDNYATIKGGNKYNWGCYNGGKIRKIKKKTRKIRKTNIMRKIKKTRKSRKNKNK